MTHLAEAKTPIMIGRTLGHYQVVEKLGAGGMGVVFKARDLHLERQVALKILPPDELADADRKRRFAQEARAASALNHPNIVHVYDIDRSDGIDYIAMEYVAGKTLDELIPRKGMRLSWALKCAIQVADALARAHGAGIIHRDLKPSNVIVDKHGLVKVLDFGLVKLTEAVGLDAETVTTGTTGCVIVGTAAYMSPEQAQGKEVDARSDIFSFGALLYEMVMGTQAFTGATKMSTLAAVINQDPVPLAGAVPVELSQIILKCLRKDPRRRFQHIDDVRSLLEDLIEEIESRKPDAALASRKRRIPAVWLVGLALCALTAVGMYSLLRHGGPSEPQQSMPLTSDPGIESHPSFSPDGNQVAYSSDADRGNLDIYVKLIGVEKPLRLTTDPDADMSPAWSPDGRSIAFVRLAKRDVTPHDQAPADIPASVIVIPAIGGVERKLASINTAPDPGQPGIAWSPDGRWLAVSERAERSQPLQLTLLSTASGEKRYLTKPPQGATGDSTPAFSPDGNTLAFSRRMNSGLANLFRIPLGEGLTPAGPAEQLTAQSGFCRSPAWTVDGREIVYSCGLPFGGPRHLWRMDPNRPGEARRLDFTGNESEEPAIARQGQRLVYSRQTEDANIWSIRRGTGGAFEAPVPFIVSSYGEWVPRYSPDGRKIVFTSNRSGSLEVWVCESDGSSPRQLTTMNAAVTGSPRWSPDQEWIIFDSNPGGKFAVFRIAAAGGTPKRMSSEEGEAAVPSWSADGKQIYFGSNRSGRWEVWRMPAGGGPATQVTRYGGHAPLESSDGRMLYYHKSALVSCLWTVPVEGGDEREAAPMTSFLNFAAKPEGLYYITPRDDTGRAFLRIKRDSDAKTETLATIPYRPGTGLEVSPDGRTILYTVYDQRRSDLMLVENFR